MNKRALRRLTQATAHLISAIKAEGCGAGNEGSPGFQPGNTCGGESKIVGKADPRVSSKLSQEDEFLKGLSEDEIRALSEYKGEDPYAPGGAIALNGVLRTEGFDGLSEEQKVAYGHIMSAFRKAPRLKKDTVLYRGTSEPMKASGGYVDFKALTSTSVDREEAENFAGLTGDASYMYEIHVPKGTRVLPTSHFHEGTTIEEEAELVLPPGMSLKVAGKNGDAVKLEMVGGSSWFLPKNF